MYCLITLSLTAVALFWIWLRTANSFPELARLYLWITPFVPLASLLNHNLDGDAISPFVRVLPYYLMVVLMLDSLYRYVRTGNHWRLGVSGVFLGFYAVLSLVQIPFSPDPRWGFAHWAWCVPGYFLFLIAGHCTRIEELTRGKFAVWSVIGYLCINLSLIAYGMAIGRVTDLFYTRNFGSFYAGNAMLTFLSLRAGLAWLQARSSGLWIFFLIGMSALAVSLSFSRTSVVIVIAYLSFVMTLRWKGMKRLALAAGVGIVLVIMGSAIGNVNRDSVIFDELEFHWQLRLGSAPLIEAFGDAMDTRKIEFAESRDRFWANPVFGAGFAQYYYLSGTGYCDAHNLFYTEAFESGLLAAIALFTVLAYGAWRALSWLLTLHRDMWPLAVSFLTYLFIAHTTGAALTDRGAETTYFSPLWGWSLFFVLGCMSSRAVPRRSSP